MPELDTILGRVLDYTAGGNPEPLSLTFLIRGYTATGRADVSAALEPALAASLEASGAVASTRDRARWLRMFAEATAVSDDSRLFDAARGLAQSLAADWGTAMLVDEAALSIDAYLASAHIFHADARFQDAIDALEGIVGGSYRPGDGVGHQIHRADGPRGSLADHICLASALLTAFHLTGRLPYSMLAEELVQTSMPSIAGDPAFGEACDAARALCRLAALHDDADYRASAVIADADYRADAGRVLERLAAQLDESGADLALFGLALTELHGW
jgi:hypothetical protein